MKTLSAIAMALLFTANAHGQSPGDFQLADTQPVMKWAFNEASLPIPAQNMSDQEKNPWLAFGLSFLLTGAGQYYNGEYGKGTIQFVGVATGLGLAIAGAGKTVDSLTGPGGESSDGGGLVVGGIGLIFGCALWSVIDAPMSANRINREGRQASLRIYPVVYQFESS